MLPPVILPVAEINPPVRILPPVALPVTVKLPNVPTAIIFVWLAVVSVPTILVPDKLPPVTLPVADINPPVKMLPPVILPVALTVAPVIPAVAPANTVWPPAGFVKISAVALALN